MTDKNAKFINWQSVNAQISDYGSNPPFDFVVIDDFFQFDFALRLSEEFPKFESQIWHGYNNPLEIKKICNNWNAFKENTYKAFFYLNSAEFLDFLSVHILSGNKVFADNGLHGGGLHIHKKGGKLNTHLDYSIHPKLKLQRKLNIIVYLNQNWKEEGGGALGFWGNESSEKPGDLITSVWSKFNRAVIFDTTQNSWHGLPNPLDCPSEETRKSMAAYFLCEPSVSVDQRGKALFAPTPDQEGQQGIAELIKKRSGVDTASSVYGEGE